MTQQPRRLNASSDVNISTLIAMPAIAIMSLVLFIAIFTKWGIRAAVVAWFLLIVGLVGWSLNQFRRARREIQTELERCHCKVMQMNYRHLRIGPFSMWDTSRSQLVYRVLIQDATGRERIVWARWGRRWYWNRDRLDLMWETE